MFGPLLEVEMSKKKCIPLWREAHFEVKMYKAHQLQTTFRSCDVEKVHDAVLARSTFRSQKCKKLPGMEHFWTFRCASPSYDLASIFRGRRSTLDRWSGKIAKRLGKRPSALHSTFDFWRKSRRIALFWCCQIQKLKKSRRIASFWMLLSSKKKKSRRIVAFLMLSTSKNEEVSRTSLVFKLADRQVDGQTNRQTDR